MFLLHQLQKHLDEEMGGLLAICRCHKVSNLLESVLSYYIQIYFIFAIDLNYLTKQCVLPDECECVQVSYSLLIKKNTHHCTHALTIQNTHKLFVSQTLDMK